MTSRRVREMLDRSDLVAVAPDASVRAAAAAMVAGRCGSTLVMTGSTLVGIFTERDLLIRVCGQGKDLDGTPVGEVMTRDPDVIGADQPIADAIRMMDEFSYRYLPVIDAGQVVGVISTRHLPFRDVMAMQPELGERHAITERL